MELTPEEIRARRLRKLETGSVGGSRPLAAATTSGATDGQQEATAAGGEPSAEGESTTAVAPVADTKPVPQSPTKPSASGTEAASAESPTKMDEDPPAANSSTASLVNQETPTKTEDKTRDEAATREELQQIVFRIMNININRYSEARFTIDPAVLANALEALDAKKYREFCAEIFIEVIKEFYEGKLIHSGDGSTSGTLSDNWNSIPSKKVKPIEIEEVLEKSGGSAAMEIGSEIAR